MSEQKAVKQEKLKIKINESGDIGKFSEEGQSFVGYFKVSVPERKTVYLVHHYYPKNLVGYQQSSAFWASDAWSKAADTLEILPHATENDVDKAIYTAFRPYGDIQKISGEQRYNLKISGSIIDQRVIRTETDEDPLNLSHLAAVEVSCNIL